MGEIGRLRELFLPWTIFVDPFPTSKSNVNWNTIGISTVQIKNGFKQSSTNQNSEIAWDLVLAAGTWTVEITGVTYNTFGIMSIQFDSVEKGTLDWYSAEVVYNVRKSKTGISVPATKKIELKLKMALKNESASSYNGWLSAIVLTRTA